MGARAWEPTPGRALLLLGALLLTSVQARPQEAVAPSAEPLLTPAPAPAEEPAAASPPPVAAPPPPSPTDNDLAEAEAALLEADGDSPASPATAVPEDVAALIGDVAAQQDGDGVKQPVKELPPVEERQGELVSILHPPRGASLQPLSDAQKVAIPVLRKARQGTATVVYQRSVGNLDAASMACGIGYLNNHFSQHFIGLPVELFRQGVLCGACVRMWCVDSICERAGLRNATFMVTDSCNDCKQNDLVAAAKGMTALSGGVNINRNPTLHVAWAFESCAPLINGGIKMMPSDRTSSKFLGLQFSNLKALLKGVAINNIAMERTNYGYWVIDTPGRNIELRPPYTLVLVSSQNQRLATRLESLKPQTLDVQFD